MSGATVLLFQFFVVTSGSHVVENLWFPHVVKEPTEGRGDCRPVRVADNATECFGVDGRTRRDAFASHAVADLFEPTGEVLGTPDTVGVNAVKALRVSAILIKHF